MMVVDMSVANIDLRRILVDLGHINFSKLKIFRSLYHHTN